jgi:hypothetical protein
MCTLGVFGTRHLTPKRRFPHSHWRMLRARPYRRPSNTVVEGREWCSRKFRVGMKTLYGAHKRKDAIMPPYLPLSGSRLACGLISGQ